MLQILESYRVSETDNYKYFYITAFQIIKYYHLVSILLLLLKHKIFSISISSIISSNTEENNTYSKEPIKTHTCKLQWTWPLVSIWLHKKLKPALRSEPQLEHTRGEDFFEYGNINCFSRKTDTS